MALAEIDAGDDNHGRKVAIWPENANNELEPAAGGNRSPGHLDFRIYSRMDDRISKLLEKAKGLPKSPGVYLMKDDKGVVIYIGKSASLRDRVSSYFQIGTRLEFKKAGLIEQIADFEILQTDTEVE